MNEPTIEDLIDPDAITRHLREADLSALRWEDVRCESFFCEGCQRWHARMWAVVPHAEGDRVYSIAVLAVKMEFAENSTHADVQDWFHQIWAEKAWRGMLH